MLMAMEIFLQDIKIVIKMVHVEVVLVFCDTEKKPYEQYEDIKRKINVFHGIDNAAEEVLIYGNPCTMQIILEHWTDVRLKSPAKKVNASVIKEFTGVDNYKGRADQRERDNETHNCGKLSRYVYKNM